MVPIFQMVLPRPSRASPCFHVRRNPAFPRFGAVASPDKTRSGYHPRDRPSGAVSPGIWEVREGVNPHICSPTCLMVAGCRMPSRPQFASLGVTLVMGLARGPAWRRVARRRRRIEGAQPRAPGSRSAGGCHVAPAPDTDRTCEAASCHAWGVRVHVTCAPAPPRPPGRPPYLQVVRKVRP